MALVDLALLVLAVSIYGRFSVGVLAAISVVLSVVRFPALQCSSSNVVLGNALVTGDLDHIHQLPVVICLELFFLKCEYNLIVL